MANVAVYFQDLKRELVEDLISQLRKEDSEGRSSEEIRELLENHDEHIGYLKVEL